MKGDRDGAIFKHISAADAIVSSVLSDPFIGQRSPLSDFLVEFYVYVSTLSLISLNPERCETLKMNGKIETRAHELADSSYVGSLCGCWIELLLLIPRINAFAMHSPTLENLSPEALRERFATFATLQLEIISWTPYPDSNSVLRSSGLFYKQALLLYLYTSTLGPSNGGESSTASDLVESTIASALFYLADIPPDTQTNTLLCWPIAIVGACILDSPRRTMIRQRLERLQELLALGNIQNTATILDALWADTAEPASPWRLHTLMKERNLSFSFA